VNATRAGWRTLVTLALCAASAAAALAHYAIDVVGDFALAHDTYDDVAHASRELVTGLAIVLALVLAARGLRACFAIAAANRTCVSMPRPSALECVTFVGGVVALCTVIVPAMEILDGRLGGEPVRYANDAFGGSILLGVGVIAVCAAAVGAIVYAVATWLVGHRDALATMIETLLCRSAGALRPSSFDLVRQRFTPRRRRAPHALRLSKRGPPGEASLQRFPHYTSTEGDSREIRFHSRFAGARRARVDARVCGTGFGRAAADCAAR
jgi:hypothetical protein